MTKAVIGIVTVVILACLGPMLLMSAVTGGGSGVCSLAAAPAADRSGQPADTGQWDTDQLTVAATVIEVGITKGVGRWGPDHRGRDRHAGVRTAQSALPR